MNTSIPTKAAPCLEHLDQVGIVKTDIDHLREAENEGLVPSAAANSAVHEQPSPAS